MNPTMHSATTTEETVGIPAIADTPAWRLFQEGGLATSYTAMGVDEASALLRDHFGINGALSRYSTEKDDTFRVDADDGQRYVLKIANPEESVAELDLQLQALGHIERVDASVPVPRVHADRHGHVLPDFVDQAGQVRRMRLLSFVDGTPLDSVDTTPDERAHVGEMLARLRLATAGFAHPADSRVLAWDVRHLLTLAPLIEGVDHADHRARLAAGLDRYADIAPQIDLLRTQVLHNDFSRSNIVVAPGSPSFVTGIIDFGDIVRTAIAIDVSTALLNQLPPGDSARNMEDIFTNGKDLLRGYLRIADLTEIELAMIPHLTMGRVIARALLTTWRARMFPDNATYILRNTQQGWAQLDWFLQRPIEQVSSILIAI